MSIVARATLAGGVKPQDENPRLAAKNAKSTTTRRVGAVLGDITNVSSQAPAGQAASKQVRSRLPTLSTLPFRSICAIMFTLNSNLIGLPEF